MNTRVSRRLLGAAALAAALPLLSGCSLLEGPPPDAPEREAPPEPETAPELVPDGTAADNLPFFTEVLRDYAAGEGAVQGEPIVNAVAEAGFDKADMSVSFDQSQTGLEADSIYVAVRFGTDCLVGQIVTEDREFVAETAPAVGPDDNLCLIGNTREIDW